MRVVDESGNQLGVFAIGEALAMARGQNRDLIEVAAKTDPPVVRIYDFGKYQYQQAKKERKARAHHRHTELKEIRIKLKTGAHDLQLKAAKANAFLAEGHKVRVEMVLRGREKYLDQTFLRERFGEFMTHIQNFIISDPVKKSPRGGLSVTIDPIK
ncbi:MAG: translation initiation factor IF-3, partial [Parcubacteria group bacterium]|nr:translation initiation factor IF-3 [Parcubacteria group bacterium]